MKDIQLGPINSKRDYDFLFRAQFVSGDVNGKRNNINASGAKYRDVCRLL